MKKFKVYYLYLAAAILWSVAVIINIVKRYSSLSYTGIGANIFFAIILFYLAYKSYHEQKDKELM